MPASIFQQTTINMDMEWGIATGQIASATSQAGRAQGYVATSDTNNHGVRATAYTPPGTNGQRSFKSASVNDTAAGTGARSVLLTYLDAAFVVHQETINLNGTTAVATVGADIAYVESIQITAVGSGQIAAGVISLFANNDGTGTVISTCAVGDQGTAYAHHYVPAGQTCYIIGYGGGGTVVGGILNMIHQQNLATPNAPTVGIGVSIIHPAVNTWDHEYQVPLVVPGPDLISLNVKPVAATASQCWAGFEYIQE